MKKARNDKEKRPVKRLTIREKLELMKEMEQRNRERVEEYKKTRKGGRAGDRSPALWAAGDANLFFFFLKKALTYSALYAII